MLAVPADAKATASWWNGQRVVLWGVPRAAGPKLCDTTLEKMQACGRAQTKYEVMLTPRVASM